MSLHTPQPTRGTAEHAARFLPEDEASLRRNLQALASSESREARACHAGIAAAQRVIAGCLARRDALDRERDQRIAQMERSLAFTRQEMAAGKSDLRPESLKRTIAILEGNINAARQEHAAAVVPLDAEIAKQRDMQAAVFKDSLRFVPDLNLTTASVPATVPAAPRAPSPVPPLSAPAQRLGVCDTPSPASIPSDAFMAELDAGIRKIQSRAALGSLSDSALKEAHQKLSKAAGAGDAAIAARAEDYKAEIERRRLAAVKAEVAHLL
jgi:hypothetical protein